ncbi:MAG: HPr family phosphocarrier protein [Lachnospiraceae bacterium]|nr:HPr family phosphocarrier protein [Lachnospiraceae bacterium]MBQ3401574.1 HPr family phosphocarrier protein [Lachnospiraceae bacterium]MBR0402627.1 HPr family phosphocarrier protein [Lachnospiraceae bacterium]
MIEKTLKITEGMKKFEDSPLALAVQKAGEFESTIYISNGNMRANAKSLMGMLSMQLDPARPVVITAEGADEAAACEAMEEYIRSQM